MTNLQKIIEKYSRMKARKERTLNGMCATCGRTEDHNGITEFGEFTHQFDIGVDARVWNEIDFLLSSLNQIRQETLDEVEVEIETYFGHIGNNGIDGKPINISNEIISEDIIKIIQSKKENI